MRISNKKKAVDNARIAILLAGLLFMTACASTGTGSKVHKIDRLETISGTPKIILMPPDIRYYLITASGIPEPHAEWTTAARENFAVAVKEYAESIGTDIEILEDSNLSQEEIKYEQLHSAVGSTVIANHFGMFKLPSKKGNFDWTLGPEISSLAKEHDADYALFVYYRDRQASGGRVAFAVLAAAVGAASDVGSESGFASLVDLRTGDIVWFNIVTAGSGELREKDGAASAVARLFQDIPTNTSP